MKNNQYSYYVYTIQENDKYFSSSFKLNNCRNLLGHWIFKDKRLLHINACKTFKEANKIADVWNKAYKDNGTYLYS